MIGWRYHLISIVAVFLALAMGLLIGTAFLNDRLVEDLRTRTEALQRDRDAQAEELRVLRRQVLLAFPYLVQDRLQSVDVVLITHAGADGDSIARSRDALDQAGADVITTLELQPSIVSPSQEQARQLAGLAGLPPASSTEEVVGETWQALARRLAVGPGFGPGGGDLLAGLLLDGFLRATDPEIGSVRAVGGIDQLFVVVGGTPSPAAEDSAASMVALIQTLSEQGAVVAVGEDGTTSRSGLVSTVRDQVAEAQGPIVTVDDVASLLGGAQLVLGLQLARESGQGGDYGLSDGAEVLPPAA